MVCNTKLTLAVFTTSAIEDNDVMPGLINLVQALQPDLSMKKQDGQVKNFDKALLGDIPAEWETLQFEINNKCLDYFNEQFNYAFLGVKSDPLKIDPRYHTAANMTSSEGFFTFKAGDTGAVNDHITNVIGPGFPSAYQSAVVGWLSSALPETVANGGPSFTAQQFSQPTPDSNNPGSNDGYQVDLLTIFNTCTVTLADGTQQKNSIVQFQGLGYYVVPPPPSPVTTGGPGGKAVVRIVLAVRDIALGMALANYVQLLPPQNPPIIVVANNVQASQINVTVTNETSGGPSGGRDDAPINYQPVVDELNKAGQGLPTIRQDVATEYEMAAFGYLTQWEASAA